MKRFFSLIVGCLVALLVVSAAAQTTQIATLLSGEDVRIFYGPESLKQAVTAAQDGDVITLSAGLFDAPSSLSKELTIRGAGIELPIISKRLLRLLYQEPYLLRQILNSKGFNFVR